jgi:hypothetical protein
MKENKNRDHDRKHDEDDDQLRGKYNERNHQGSNRRQEFK